MVCPLVCGDNPRAFASELSPVQEDKQGYNFKTTYNSVDLANYEIFRAELGHGDQKYFAINQKIMQGRLIQVL